MVAGPCLEPLGPRWRALLEFPRTLTAAVSLSPVPWAGRKCWEFSFPGAALSQQETGVVNTDLSFVVSQCGSSEVSSEPVAHRGNPLVYSVYTGFTPVLTSPCVF